MTAQKPQLKKRRFPTIIEEQSIELFEYLCAQENSRDFVRRYRYENIICVQTEKNGKRIIDEKRRRPIQ